MDIRLRKQAAALLIVGSLAVASCASSRTTELPEGFADAQQLRTEVLLTDQLVRSSLGQVEDNVIIDSATGVLVAACMQDKGWDWTFVPEPIDVATAMRSVFWSEVELLLFDDLSEAADQGYEISAYLRDRAQVAGAIQEHSDNASGKTPDPNSMSPADADRFGLDFFGSDEARVEITERDGSVASLPGEGCIGDATKAVFGDIGQYLAMLDLRQSAQDDLFESAYLSAGVQRSLSDWRGCIQDVLAAPTIIEPRDVLVLALGSPDRELEIAAADATCKASSDLSNSFAVAYFEAAGFIDLEADLIAYGAFNAEAVDRARAILGMPAGE